jgi:hypothetical protein
VAKSDRRRIAPSIGPSPARIVIEHSIRDLRQFQALTLPDRHRRRGQEARVCAVVALRARRCRPGRRDRRQVA